LWYNIFSFGETSQHDNIEIMSKVKMSVAKKTMKDPELLDLFNQMVGAGDPDPNIAVPKYDKLLEESTRVVEMFKAFANSPFAKVFRKDYNNAFDDILRFCQESEVTLTNHTLKVTDSTRLLSGDKLNALNENPELMQKYINSINSKYDLQELAETYTNLKQCQPVQEIVMITKNLKSVLNMEKERAKTETHNLENKETLSMMFITKCEGTSLMLFNFCALDFKQISYNEELLTPQLQQYMLYFLHILYKRGLEVVRLITSPDIDVNKFSEVLVRNIGEVKKHIPRCDKAFDKIASSVGLLRNNFDDYYKDFVISQNPGIIIESFVGDVAKSSSADVQTTAQFRKIIQFYKQRMAAAKIDDPKIKKILGMVGSNLDVLEEEVKADHSTSPPVPAEPAAPTEQPTAQEIGESFLPDHLKREPRKGKGSGRSTKK
jgi:hypothetical protein